MARVVKVCKNWTLIFVLFAFLAVVGCEGTETHDQLDDTVKELTGKKNIDRMDQMKKDLFKAGQQQADRFKEIDGSSD